MLTSEDKNSMNDKSESLIIRPEHFENRFFFYR